MDVFYNPKGIGDCLVIPLEQGNRYEMKHKQFGDITKIMDQNGKVLGYNVFRASNHFALSETGKLTMTETLLAKLQALFTDNGLSDKLDFDLSPKFVVGYVKSKIPHENADKLNVCEVDIATETLQIVCGAPNVDAGQKVVVAKVGAVMPGGMRIKPAKLRGVPSNGMICSQKELGLPNAPKEKGIYVLDDSFTAGKPFQF